MNDDAQLFDQHGQRLYLTQSERDAFLAVAKNAPRDRRTFATILHASGARISEALALTPARIDIAGRRVVFETLKRRKRGLYRAIPLSDEVIDTLDMVHGLTEAHRAKKRDVLDRPLWSFSRTTAWRFLTEMMDDAGIVEGRHRTPKGLRHGFGINAILKGVPLTTLRDWMGHKHIETTAIYLKAVSAEERTIAERMWM